MMRVIFLFIFLFGWELSSPQDAIDAEAWLCERIPGITLEDAATAVTNKETRLDFRLAGYAWLARENPEHARTFAALIAPDDDPVMRAAVAPNPPGIDERKWRRALEALPEGQLAFALDYSKKDALVQTQEAFAHRGRHAEGGYFGWDDFQEEMGEVLAGLCFARLQRYAVVLLTDEDGVFTGVFYVAQGIFSRSALLQNLELDDDEIEAEVVEREGFLICDIGLGDAAALSDDFLVLSFGPDYPAQRSLLYSWIDAFTREGTGAGPETPFARQTRALDGGLYLTMRGTAVSEFLRIFGLGALDEKCEVEIRLVSFTTGKFISRWTYASADAARSVEARFHRVIADFRAELSPKEAWADLDTWLQQIRVTREGVKLTLESMGETRLDQLLVYALLR